MLPRLSRFRLFAGMIAIGVAFSFSTHARADDVYSWTVLTPENDSRDDDERDFDEFDSKSLVTGMNEVEEIFGHRLVWDKIAIKDLLATCPPFCELRFDAVHPLILTAAEKAILQEYFRRGGFVLFQEDTYPYGQDEFWAVKSWPVIDFIRKELPAADPQFTVDRATDAHLIFHNYYQTRTADATRHELEGNPYTPNRTLLFFRGSPCAFVYGRYNLIDDYTGKWDPAPRPFEHIFSLEEHGYQLTVNIYFYAMSH
jgi:hypothetical protein